MLEQRPQIGWLNTTPAHSPHPQLWRLRVKTQGVGKAMPPGGCRGGTILVSSYLTQVASHPVCPWLQLYSSICAFISMFYTAFPICVVSTLQSLPFKKQHQSYWIRPHANDILTTWFDFKDPVSKEGHCIGYFPVTVREPKHLVKDLLHLRVERNKGSQGGRSR